MAARTPASRMPRARSCSSTIRIRSLAEGSRASLLTDIESCWVSGRWHAATEPSNKGTTTRAEIIACAPLARNRIQDETHHSSDDRAVDPDELKITADRELDSTRRRRGIPSPHCVRDQLAHLRPIPLNEPEHAVSQPSIDTFQQYGIVEDRLAKIRESVRDRVDICLLGALGTTDQSGLGVGPDRS